MSLRLALTGVALMWLTLILLSPVALASGRMSSLTMAVYHAGSLVCHQRPERSFHLAGAQLPVCARCFGLYLSGAVGLVAVSRRRGSISAATTRLLLVIAALPIAITVALEWLGLIHTTNVVRMLTGLPLGFAAALVIVRSLARPGRCDMIAR